MIYSYSPCYSNIPFYKFHEYYCLEKLLTTIRNLFGYFFLFLFFDCILVKWESFFTKLMHKFFILLRLLHSPTCFYHHCAHLQEDNCISTASGIVTLFRWLFSTLVTCFRQQLIDNSIAGLPFDVLLDPHVLTLFCFNLSFELGKIWRSNLILTLMFKNICNGRRRRMTFGQVSVSK